MIITRAPFRVSYVGGGTDFEDYYQNGYGRVVSSTIDKYIYVSVIRRFDSKIHVRYSKFECVSDVDELDHDIIRETMKKTGVLKGVEIVIMSEIPAAGSGLGSSSSLTVGLLLALYKLNGIEIDKQKLIDETCEIEIDILNQPIGKQDQVAIISGGFNSLLFDKNYIRVVKLEKRKELLQKSSMLFYLGNGRKSGDILCKHKENINSKREILDKQRELSNKLVEWINSNEEIEKVGELVSESWQLKKAMTPNASSDMIDKIIRNAIKAGACGAKVCGAGGGGFLLVICEREKQDRIRQELYMLSELKFNFENEGAKLLYAD